MMGQGVLLIRNRQRDRQINVRKLRQVILHLLRELLRQSEFEIGVHLLGDRAMVQANEGYLRHAGCTDVISFDYTGRGLKAPLQGDLLVCVSEAVGQARRFHTSWPQEVVRYIVHGLLHLCGYDDHKAADRRRMKAQEDALVRRLARRFELRRIALTKSTRSV